MLMLACYLRSISITDIFSPCSFTLATLFASLLIRPPPNFVGRQTSHERQKAIDFVLGFLMAGDEE